MMSSWSLRSVQLGLYMPWTTNYTEPYKIRIGLVYMLYKKKSPERITHKKYLGQVPLGIGCVTLYMGGGVRF